ncbi:MAG: recombinase family protein [Oscillospiraceae bacterium]|nr:recombinase family protein [Oscillospiraceae bacterium]
MTLFTPLLLYFSAVNIRAIPSYGYKREIGEKIQEIDDDEAAIVRRIFAMYLQDDYSIVKIAKILNAKAVKTKRDKQWHMGIVKLVLTNPNYVGKVRYAMNDASRYFEADGHYTPIIDETIFYQVQTKMGSIKRVV